MLEVYIKIKLRFQISFNLRLIVHEQVDNEQAKSAIANYNDRR